VSRGPKCPWLVPTPKGVPECELTTWVVCFDADSCLIYSLIPGLPTRPSTPFLELEAGSVPPSLNFPQLDFVKPSSGFHPVTWERVIVKFQPQTFIKSIERLLTHITLDGEIVVQNLMKKMKGIRLSKIFANISF
jgi:hypothetical protein